MAESNTNGKRLEDSRLKVFIAVFEERSFTIAARKMGITQGAVSQCISDLEDKVGARLFERDRSGVSPTAEGETFRLFAKRIISDYEKLNVVFSDYPRYSTAIESLAHLKDSPVFPVLEDLL